MSIIDFYDRAYKRIRQLLHPGMDASEAESLVDQIYREEKQRQDAMNEHIQATMRSVQIHLEQEAQVQQDIQAAQEAADTEMRQRWEKIIIPLCIEQYGEAQPEVVASWVEHAIEIERVVRGEGEGS